MAGLQRSAVSFRRQGSSGIVWDDKFLSELSQIKPEQQQQEEEEKGETKQEEQVQGQDNNNSNNTDKVDVVKDVNPTIAPPTNTTFERSRSTGGERRGYRTGKVSPAIDPPSPKISACGFCSAFGKQATNSRSKKPGKRRSR